MLLKDYHKTLQPYAFFGVDVNNDEVQSRGSCPFCDASKFSIKTETGQFRCLRCEETGNVYSFMFRLHQLSTEGTSQKDYASLSLARSTSVDSLIHFGLAKSRLTGDWLIPAYNLKGNLANLYKLTSRKDENGSPKLAPMSAPGCKPQPFGTNHLIQNPKPVLWVTEGVWDACKLWDVLSEHKQTGEKLIKTTNPDDAMLAQQDVLGVPGCGNVDVDWFPLFEGKEVRIVFDNDHPKVYGPDHEKAGQIMKHPKSGQFIRPGWDGMERISTLLGKSKHRPKQLRVLFWNENYEEQGHNPNLPDGYDIRDLFKDQPGAAGLRLLLNGLQQVKLSSPKKEQAEPQNAIEPIQCESFEELCKHWSSVLHFTQELRDTLAIMLAVVLSTESEKVNHLWLRVIGPPGSGKSTLAEAISVAREWVAPKSIVTGFHSGFVDQSGESEKQTASLIPELDCKTVIMKDGDTLVNSPNRDRLLSELRDLYDGTSRAHYRNMQVDEFEDIRMSFILCGTDELRSLNRTFLGERFLDCEIMRRGEDTSPYLQRSVNNTYNSLVGFVSPKEADEAVPVDRMMFLKQVTYGFIKYLKSRLANSTPPSITGPVALRLQAVAELVSFMRARIRKDNNEHHARPRPELGTRLSSQFTKLAFFSAIVLGKPAIDEETMRVVLKVMHDTSIGLQYEITESLAKEPTDGVTIRQLTLGLSVPETSIRRLLNDMREFGIAQPFSVSNNSGQRGRDRHLYQLTPMMRGLWDRVYSLTTSSPRANKNQKRKPVRRQPV